MGAVCVHICGMPHAGRWFRDNDGRSWWMEFHNYLGPSFNTEGPDGDDWQEPPDVVWEKFGLWLKRYRKRTGAFR